MGVADGVCTLRMARERPAGATSRRAGKRCAGKVAQGFGTRGVSVGLVSSVLWDRLSVTRRSVLLVLLRLGACGTTTGGGMTVASLEVACRWPVELVSSAVFYLD